MSPEEVIERALTEAGWFVTVDEDVQHLEAHWLGEGGHAVYLIKTEKIA